MPQAARTLKRLPPWLRRSLPPASAERTHGILDRHKLNTVCESALCPNRNECYSNRTATFMILGNTCTRSCGFCAINVGRGEALQADEPVRVARAAKEMGLQYVVITSVARDDLEDEGAHHFAETIRAVRRAIDGVKIEVLTPDFHARPELLGQIADAEPDVFNHNLETVKRLQKEVRPQAAYRRSLEVLAWIKKRDPRIFTKSGLMLGLGESRREVLDAGRDLREHGVDILTLGQYLPPGKDHLALVEYIEPGEFEAYAADLRIMGFRDVFAGPYVRSSYHAGETFSHCGDT